MKTVTLLLVASIALGVSGFLIKVPVLPVQPARISPVGWVHLQKLILPLFDNVCEDSTDPTIVRLAKEYDLDPSSGIYLKPDVLVNLQKLKSGKGLLPKGEIFTEYSADHVNELKIIYEVFQFAKDFNTFYKSAAWARQNVNCGLFIDAIYLAVLNRRDMDKISVPAPYEVLPNYFIQKDIILKASALLSGESSPSDNFRVEGNSYAIDADYTSNLIENDDDSKLSYFREDVGLNTYYYLTKLRKAPWAYAPENFNTGYGEYLYHIIKQMFTRYNLERYSNGLPELDIINWDTFATTPYDPLLIYSNGKEFSSRMSCSGFTNSELVKQLKDFETNIDLVVADMVKSGYNKTQILDHLMENLITHDKSYEMVARQLLIGNNLNDQLSALEHFMTSPRDPLFWTLKAKIVNLVDNALLKLPSYSRNELYFPGVEIVNVEIKKVQTLFDYYQLDVTDALKSGNSNAEFQVKISQPRLNHKPFALKLNITSLVNQKGLVKIYLGPKTAPGALSEKKNLFMLLDSFECNLKAGNNILSRSSDDIKKLSEDFASLRAIRKMVEDAEFGLNVPSWNNFQSLTGFPSRLILPKGTIEGLPLQVLVFVSPFVKSTIGEVYPLTGMSFNSVALSPGYPLDLFINDAQLFSLPNVIIKEITVMHKGDKSDYTAADMSKKWQSGDSYKPSSRPDYTQPKQPFDYASKKAQFGNKEQLSGKKGGYNKEYFDTKDEIQNIYSEGDNKIEKVDINKDTKKNLLETSNVFDIDIHGVSDTRTPDGNRNVLIDVNNDKKIVKVDIDKDITQDKILGNQNMDYVNVYKIQDELPHKSSVYLNVENVLDNDNLGVPVVSKIRSPSVYDYILPDFDYDDVQDERVYE